MHLKYIPIYIQQYATLHSQFISGNYSACFGWYLHPSSGAHTAVSTASGICHNVTATCRLAAGSKDEARPALFLVVVLLYLFFVLFYISFVMWRPLYCLCVYVYWTTATGCQPNCSCISYHINQLCNIASCLIYIRGLIMWEMKVFA